MSNQHDRDEEHSEREIANIGIVGAFAQGDFRFAVPAMRDRNVSLEARSRLNREEKQRILVAQLTDVYGAYVISFPWPPKRDELRKAFGMGQPKTSAKWLNELLKAISCCETKAANRRADIIKLALHHGVHVADFPAFFAASGSEEKCVAEYKKLMRNKRPEAQQNYSFSPDDAFEQAVSNSTSSTAESAKHSVQSLVNETPKLREKKRVFGFRRHFNLIAGNPEVSNQLEAALLSGSNEIVGSRYNLVFTADKFGITALKVQPCDS